MKSPFAILIQLGIVALVAFGVWWALRKGGERNGESGPQTTPTTGAQEPRANPVGQSSSFRKESGIGRASPKRTWRETIDKRLKGEPKKVPTREELERYLNTNKRTPDSLLAAALLNPDLNYLAEAAQRYPNDPQVQFAVLSLEADPNSREMWIQRFKESDPNNPLPSYFAARDLLKAGRVEEGLAELKAATTKDQYKDYAMDYWQGLEEFFMDSGEDAVDAKLHALFNTPLPQMGQIREVSSQLLQQYDARIAAGDVAGAEEIAAIGLSYGNRFSQGDGSTLLLTEKTGLEIEAAFVNRLDPAKQYAFLGGSTVNDMKAGLQAQHEEFQQYILKPDRLNGLSDNQVMAYFDRVKLFGEKEAGKWLLKQSAP